MKSGLVTSAVLHTVVLSYGLWAFSSPKTLDATYAEALPVEIIMSDTFSGVTGEADAPITERPAPTPITRPETLPMPAENIGENEADLDTPAVPDVKPNDVEPTPAPKAAEAPPPEPEPVEPEPEVAEAPPPEPQPTPEPVAETPPPAEPDPVEQAIEQAAAEPAPQPDPVPRNVPVPQAKPRPPAPEVAEAAKPEKPKKTETSSREKPRDRQVAEVPSEEPSEFNTDDIAALLSKEKAAGGGAKRSTEQASLGSKKTTGSTLSRSQLGEIQGLLNEQMARCYSMPTGALDAEELKVSIHIDFDPSGALVGAPTIVRGGEGSSMARIASEAAVRAIRRCAPFNLPAELYSGGWESTTLNFDPSAMF